MKKKIKIKGTLVGKETEITQTVRDLDHLAAQQKYPALKQEDKRKKKPKYKPDYTKEINTEEK